MPRSWFEMKKADKDAEIFIYGEIGKSWWDDDAVSAKQFTEDLAALGDVSNITVRINSPGGDAFDGIAISNALKNHKANVVAQVDGIAASAASIIAMGANTVRMAQNSFMLIHGASGFAIGNADNMRQMAEDLDRIDKSIVQTYATKTGKTAARIKAIMKEDRLMDADEARELGLADEITDEIKLAANYSLRLLPKAAQERIAAAMGPAEGASSTTVEGKGSEPHPPAVEGSQGAETQSTASPPPTSAQGAQVIDLNAARKQGADEHKAYTDQVADLCVLAGMADRTAEFVKSNKPIETIRKELIDLKATEAAQRVVMPQHPAATGPQGREATASLWGKIADKLNSRVK